MIPAKRIANIIDYLTFDIFRYTTRGLYEEHKFLYVLLLALKLALNMGIINNTEFQTFIKGIRHISMNPYLVDSVFFIINPRLIT